MKRCQHKAAVVDSLNAMLAHSYARMELRLDGKDWDTHDPPELPSLAEYSLAEMVEASRVIDEHEKTEQRTRRRKPGEGWTLKMKCDDRLVAALYACEHYDCDRDQRHIEPIVTIGDKALVVCSMKACGVESEDEE